MKSWLLLFASFSIFLFTEYQLEKYGFGYAFYHPNLPYGFNTDYNHEKNYVDYGFMIEDEGFISVIKSGRNYINDQGFSLKIIQIKKYVIINGKIFVLADTDKGEKIINIILDEHRNKGDKIQFTFFNLNDFQKSSEVNWINVSSNKLLFRWTFYFLQLIILVQIYRLILVQINRRRKTFANKC